MIWTDINDIACELFDAAPDLNPLTLRFTDLRDRVMALKKFEGNLENCNEKILEAIQMAWLEEFEDQD
jgi:FeS assembly protein IscX